jgi:hypothetical protein
MEQAETIEVMGVTLTRVGDGVARWHGRVGASRLQAWGPGYHAHLYRPGAVPPAVAWGVIMTCDHGGAQVQLYRSGPTLDDAIRALRGALNAVTETRATIGRDLAAMLDAGEVAA